MCLTCTIEEVTGLDLATDEGHEALDELGRIPWPDVSDGMREAAALIAALYAGEASTGGPMHVVTDDYNVEDSNIEFCHEEAVEDPLDRASTYKDWPKIQLLSVWICVLLEPMDEKQRSVSIALAHGDLSEIHGKVFMPHTEFPIREEVRDEEGSVIGTQWGFRHRSVQANP